MSFQSLANVGGENKGSATIYLLTYLLTISRVNRQRCIMIRSFNFVAATQTLGSDVVYVFNVSVYLLNVSMTSLYRVR